MAGASESVVNRSWNPRAVQQPTEVAHVPMLCCPERKRNAHAVSEFLPEQGCGMVDIKQFGERPEGHFFMRVDFAAEGDASTGRPGPP